MASAVPDNGVVLADDWKLVPVDARNWELCQFRRPCDNNGNPKEGEARWFRCGRFYSYGAIGHAMAYVADEPPQDMRLFKVENFFELLHMKYLPDSMEVTRG